MDSQKKHYLITALTLGVIAASSAAIIGLTNMITRDRIAQNEQNKINSGIAAIFGENAKANEQKSLKEAYKYVQYYYDVKDGGEMLGYAFKTSGSNMYGKISLMIGFYYATEAFKGLSIVVNEQTYATTLVDNYINPVNGGTREVEDVYCGATYGAKLVRDMIDECYVAMGEVALNG